MEANLARAKRCNVITPFVQALTLDSMLASPSSADSTHALCVSRLLKRMLHGFGTAAPAVLQQQMSEIVSSILANRKSILSDSSARANLAMFCELLSPEMRSSVLVALVEVARKLSSVYDRHNCVNLLRQYFQFGSRASLSRAKRELDRLGLDSNFIASVGEAKDEHERTPSYILSNRDLREILKFAQLHHSAFAGADEFVLGLMLDYTYASGSGDYTVFAPLVSSLFDREYFAFLHSNPTSVRNAILCLAVQRSADARRHYIETLQRWEDHDIAIHLALCRFLLSRPRSEHAAYEIKWIAELNFRLDSLLSADQTPSGRVIELALEGSRLISLSEQTCVNLLAVLLRSASRKALEQLREFLAASQSTLSAAARKRLAIAMCESSEFLGMNSELAAQWLDSLRMLLDADTVRSLLDRKSSLVALERLLVNSVCNFASSDHVIAQLASLLELLELLAENDAKRSIADAVHNQAMQISGLHEIVLGGSSLKFALLRLLRQVYSCNSSLATFDLLRLYAAAYGGTASQSDRELFAILRSFEEAQLSLAMIGFVWGNTAKEDLKLQRIRDKEDFVMLVLLEGKLLDFQLLHQSTAAFPYRSENSAAYDPQFLLPLFLRLIELPNVNLSKTIELGILSYAVAALSSESSDVRALAYTFMQKIDALLVNLDIRDLPQIQLVLRHLRNSIAVVGEQVPGIFTAFVRHALPVVRTPDHFVYVAVNSFFLQRALIEADDVPLFYNLFHSGTETAKKERSWILRVLKEGMVSRNDYRMCKKRHVFQVLMAFFDSIAADAASRKLILQIFSSSVSLSGCLQYLCERVGFIGWINTSLTSSTKYMQLVHKDVIEMLRGFLPRAMKVQVRATLVAEELSLLRFPLLRIALSCDTASRELFTSAVETLNELLQQLPPLKGHMHNCLPVEELVKLIERCELFNSRDLRHTVMQLALRSISESVSMHGHTSESRAGTAKSLEWCLQQLLEHLQLFKATEQSASAHAQRERLLQRFGEMLLQLLKHDTQRELALLLVESGFVRKTLCLLDEAVLSSASLALYHIVFLIFFAMLSASASNSPVKRFAESREFARIKERLLELMSQIPDPRKITRTSEIVYHKRTSDKVDLFIRGLWCLDMSAFEQFVRE